jgi:hypothetical protein
MSSRHRPARRLATLAALLPLVVLLPSAPALAGGGRVIGATKIVDHGPGSARYTVVVIAEGFREVEQASFAARASEYATHLRTTAPFSAWWQTFNVWRIDVASNESGADDPVECGGTGLVVDTYFDARFCAGGIRRALVVNQSTARAVLDAHVPEWDMALVVVNTTVYGGTGGGIATTSLAGSWKDIAIHEFGHSGFGLADEYEYWAGCGADPPGSRDHHPAWEPSAPNVTIQTDPALVKWRALFHPAVPIPTTENPDCALCDLRPNPYPGEVRVGLYEGADYYHCDAYRPAHTCMMRAFGAFCPVCRNRIEQTLKVFARPLLDPIAAPLRAGTSVTLAGSGFGAGSVVNLWVSTATGAVSHGPYVPTAVSPTTLTWDLPAVDLAQGYASVRVVNTDAGYLASEVRGALLVGDAAAGVPTILAINGTPLAPPEASVGLAHADTVVAGGGGVVLVGTGFADALVNVFTPEGNLGPLTPAPGHTDTHVGITIPASAPAGPGTFQVVNRRATPGGTTYANSNAVAAVLVAVPTITGVAVAGATITVRGTGFSRASVINLFNRQGSGVVNLGGLSGGVPRVPIAFVSDTEFTFARPAGAVAGPAFVEVLNPPFIPFSSSGSDPDGAVTLP